MIMIVIEQGQEARLRSRGVLDVTEGSLVVTHLLMLWRSQSSSFEVYKRR
jgi:hypothetical protein